MNGRATFADFQINGAQQGENNIMIDGLPTMGGGYNDPTVIPNLEGIQSVQILANAYSSEYGRGAGQMSITTKSGSNKFHGLASYENRNEALMANTDSNKLNLIHHPRPIPLIASAAFKVNDIGGEVDGPILKDRLFFTGSLHYLTHNFGTGESLHVPSLSGASTGDWGSTYVAGTNGQPTPVYLYNPSTVTPVSGATNVYQPPGFPHSSNCNNLYASATSSHNPGSPANAQAWQRAANMQSPAPTPLACIFFRCIPSPMPARLRAQIPAMIPTKTITTPTRSSTRSANTQTKSASTTNAGGIPSTAVAESNGTPSLTPTRWGRV